MFGGNVGQNVYPNPDNYPAPTFPQPVPAPDVDPDDAGTFITVGYSWEWQQVLLAAVDQLRLYSTWQGSHDDKILAQDRATWLKALLQTPVSGSSDIQAPYWDEDSGDDAADTAPVADQTWYGTWDGETFLETVSYVFLTNFLSTLVSPQAAIKFLTIPRAFRVAIRQSPHGANLLLFLDGGLFKVINGYSPFDKVAEFLIASPGSELLLVHDGTHDPDATPDDDGNYTVDVIRGRLTSDDVVPPNIRYTGDPPVMQTTTDGGTTWVDTPSTDPRYNPAALLPPLTHYTGIECDVAARMTAQLEDTITNFLAAGDAAQFATEIMALIAFPFGWVGWVLDVILLVFNTWVDIGQANIEAAFTSTVYDDIRCTFSCFVGSDGQISQSSLDAAYEQIKADHPGTVASTIDSIRWLYTDVPMSNAGVVRDETGDCSECPSCDWFVEWDFTGGFPDGWRVYVDASYVYGAFTGAAFVGGHTGSPLELFFYMLEAGLAITGYSYFGSTFHGTGIGNTINVMNITSTGSPPTWTVYSTGGLPSVTDGWVVGSPSLTVTEGFGLYLVCDSNGTGTIRIDKVRLSGTGTPPSTGVRVNSLS
jgi:hypothetical protein